MTEFHFLRPLWLLALIPLVFFAIAAWKKKGQQSAWSAICDPHLLSVLLKQEGSKSRRAGLICVMLSTLFVIVSLSGPSWKRFPVPTYQQVLPRVFLLDMSSSMQTNDVAPNRWMRAKFKLHDAFLNQTSGQSALIAYTGEPFVVAPLTEDAKTIDALLDALTLDIMPVKGNDLSEALRQAGRVIEKAGFRQGNILVLTAKPPDALAIAEAARLSAQHMDTSIMPVLKQALNPSYAALAQSGHGDVIALNDAEAFTRWMQHATRQVSYQLNEHNAVPVWRDDGRWFLIPALALLLPVFRRGWLQRVDE